MSEGTLLSPELLLPLNPKEKSGKTRQWLEKIINRHQSPSTPKENLPIPTVPTLSKLDSPAISLPQTISELIPATEQKTSPQIENPTNTESRPAYDTPSINDLPFPVRTIAESDLVCVRNYADELKTIYALRDDPGFYWKAANFFEANNPFKYWSPSAITATRQKEHFSLFQKPYTSDSLVLSNNEVWGTKELWQLIHKTREETRKIAEFGKVALEKSGQKLPGLMHTYEAIIDTQSIEMYSEIRWEDANIEMKEITRGEMLLYHGTYLEPFLDMLESGGLLSRKKQEEVLGKNIFSTKANKRANQEMEQVAFSVNSANWGYTQDPSSSEQHQQYLGKPSFIWIVADGGYLIKEQQCKFLFTDGIHIFSKDVSNGFELPFNNQPVCFMMSKQAFERVLMRVNYDQRFNEQTLNFLKTNTVVVDESQIPVPHTDEEWQRAHEYRTYFKPAKGIITALQEKITASYPEYLVPTNPGYIVPSGEIGEDQSGHKVMTYCWIER